MDGRRRLWLRFALEAIAAFAVGALAASTLALVVTSTLADDPGTRYWSLVAVPALTLGGRS